MEASKKINRDLKLQKAIVIGLFAMMIIVFVYSLIFMTPFFDLYKIDGTFSKSNLANWGIDITTLPEACYISKNGKPLVLYYLFLEHKKEKDYILQIS